MTPVFCCGFECGVSVSGQGPHWNIGSNASFNTSTVRSGARSLRVNPTAAVAAPALSPLTIGVSKFVIRFYIRFASLPTSDVDLLRISFANTVGIRFKQSDSKLYTSLNAATASASGVSVTTGVWYLVDYKFDGESNPWAQALTIDGTTEVTSSSALTALSPSTGGFFIGGAGEASKTYDLFIDDIVVSNTTSDYPIGTGFVNHFIPTSDGTHNTGTAGTFITGAAGANITNATTTSFQLVDDVPLDDATPDTNDYINQAGNGTTNYVENVFGPASGISTPTYAPRAVEAIVGYHQAATTSGASTFKVNDNGTEDTIVALSGNGVTTTRYSRKHYATPPTGGTWTISGAGNFNNIRSRFGYSSDANPDQYFDCTMIEAEFGDPPPAPIVKAFSLLGVG